MPEIKTDEPLLVRGPSQPLIDRTPVRHYGGDYGLVTYEGHIVGEAYRVIGREHGVDMEAPARENALLWSAAPKMLEALEQILAITQAGHVDQTARMAKIRGLATGVISLARGEQ